MRLNDKQEDMRSNDKMKAGLVNEVEAYITKGGLDPSSKDCPPKK